MSQTWTAITVTADPELAEAVGSFLLDCGAPGLESEESPSATRITAHFADAGAVTRLQTFLDALRELAPDRARPRVEVTTIADTGWAENWKAHFPPLSVGERLFIHPPWIDGAQTDRIAIVVDPGMAFGTGHHASTRGCLVLLERALDAQPDARVLDLGTGSGILAIAAAKLGAREVWAVDTDPEACAVAIENCAVNGVAAAVRIADDVGTVPGRFEIVVANLFASQLISFAPLLAARLRPGGCAIGAGILAAEADAVHTAWDAAGLRGIESVTEDGWRAIAHRRDA